MQQNYKYHYFYKIEDITNGKFYYGIHSTNNLDDGYMGSGSRLQTAYRLYGKENFKKTILKFFETREMASIYESEMVTEECVKDLNCYNLKIGGDYGLTTGTILVKDKDNVFLRVKPNDENYLNGIYVPIGTGMISVFDTIEEKYKSITKDEFSKNQKRYIFVSKGKITVKDKNGNTKSVSVDSEEYLSGEVKPIWVGKRHTLETKMKMSSTHKINSLQKGEKNSQYGTCWINNGKECAKIKKDEIEAYIEKGWVKGRFIDKNKIKYKLDDSLLETIKECRKNNLTWYKIAKKLNINKSTLSRYKKRYNIEE